MHWEGRAALGAPAARTPQPPLLLCTLSHPQRYLKPKFARQKNKKEAVYNEAKRTRVQLVEQFLRDPHIQPF